MITVAECRPTLSLLNVSVACVELHSHQVKSLSGDWLASLETM